MRILVTNDDGISAPGLWDLVRAVRPLGEVVVSAPDRDRSGVGAGLTLHSPLRIQKHTSPVEGVTAHAVDGTPGDATIMGIHEISNEPLDVVVSGFNSGNNLSADVLLSGTVGAALHGYSNGISSLAFSVHHISEAGSPLLADLVRSMVTAIVADGGEPSLLNVNFPLIEAANCPFEQHKHSLVEGVDGVDGGVDGELVDVVETSLAPRIMVDRIVMEHRANRDMYWNARESVWKPGDPVAEESDLGAMLSRKVSVTPLNRLLGDGADHPATSAVIAAARAVLGR